MTNKEKRVKIYAKAMVVKMMLETFVGIENNAVKTAIDTLQEIIDLTNLN